MTSIGSLERGLFDLPFNNLKDRADIADKGAMEIYIKDHVTLSKRHST